jgi:hypothetical protein
MRDGSANHRSVIDVSQFIVESLGGQVVKREGRTRLRSAQTLE